MISWRASNTIRRTATAAAFVAVVSCLTLLAAAAVKQAETEKTTAASSGRKQDSPKSAAGQIDGQISGGRWREGTKLVDICGSFRITGDRVTFFSTDGKSRFACLENLNSERIARMVSESPESLEWVIQGTVTEFRQENYLLVTQAVLRTRQTGAASRSVVEPESPDPSGT
jgi:hypothetical protein